MLNILRLSSSCFMGYLLDLQTWVGSYNVISLGLLSLDYETVGVGRHSKIKMFTFKLDNKG